VLVLLFNGMRCPLTAVAARHTDDRRDNFDIYLPEWLARWNKHLALYVVGLVLWPRGRAERAERHGVDEVKSRCRTTATPSWPSSATYTSGTPAPRTVPTHPPIHRSPPARTAS
jgi:hypothetical protein